MGKASPTRGEAGGERRSHAVGQPFGICTTSIREAGVTLSAFTCSFISDAELCCEHVGQQAALLWVGAYPEPTPAPQGGFAPCPRRILFGCPRIAWLAARTEARWELAMIGNRRGAFSPPGQGSSARIKFQLCNF